MMTSVSRKMSQSNPDLSVSHMSLQRSLEGLGSNKTLDSVSGRSFGDQLSLNNHRSKLVYMDKIAALELQLSSLVSAVSERAAELNNKPIRSHGLTTPHSGTKESMPRCEEVGSCWSWIVQLSRLSQIHITYAAEYHKFFYEARDIDGCLEQEKARVFADLSSSDRRSLGSLPFECRRLSSCMRSHLSCMMLLGQRAQELVARSGSVQPIHLRVPSQSGEVKRPASSEHRRAVALCSFTSSEGAHVLMDEEVTVVDQTDRNVWRVEKASGGGQLDVPSVCLALLGPDNDALETIGRLRDTIVSVWVQILASYKQHISDLFRTFLEFIQMEKYTVDSDIAEASLFTFMAELESSYLCYLNDMDAAAFAKLLSEIRAKRAPPSEQAVRASKERRLSNVSLSSVVSGDGGGGSGGGSGVSRSNSQRSSGRRARSLRESEVIQPRALLKVLIEHVEALERLRNRRLDAQEPNGSHEEAPRSPYVPAIRIHNDDELSTSTSLCNSNVYVFSNQTDIEKLSGRPTQLEQHQQLSHRRKRNQSAASSRTVTSTVMNEEFHRPLMLGVTTTDGPSLVRSSSEIGDRASVNLEPPHHVSRMYWMVNQPTKVERQIHRSELTVGCQLAVDLPHRNFVSAKRLLLDDDGGAGVFAVTKLECSYPPRRSVVDSGAELGIRFETRQSQTLGNFKEVKPVVALATQTQQSDIRACTAFLDLTTVTTSVRAADKPPVRSETSAQTLGDFKEVKPVVALATQTQQSDIRACTAFLDLTTVTTSVRAADKPPVRSEKSAQTLGDFKEVKPVAALATQTQTQQATNSGAFFDFASIDARIKISEKPSIRSEVSVQTPMTETRESSFTAARAQVSSSIGARPVSLNSSVFAALVEKPKAHQGAQTSPAQIVDTGASQIFMTFNSEVKVATTLMTGSAKFRQGDPTSSGTFLERLSAEVAVRALEMPSAKSDRPVQTSPITISDCSAFLTIQTGDSAAVAALARGVNSTASCRPRPAVDCGAHLALLAKEASVKQSSPTVASAVSVGFRPEEGVATVRCRPPAGDAASQTNFQLELVGRLVVRNHNLECAQLLSLTRTVCDPAELNSAGQARLVRDAGLHCTEWGELGSSHLAEAQQQQQPRGQRP